MKKLVINLILTFGFVFCAFPAFSDSIETAETPEEAMENIQANDVGPCPTCSGDAFVITGVTFQTGTSCTCSGTTSLTIGPDVTIQTGATVTFQSEKINFKSDVTIEQGATIATVTVKAPASITLTLDPVSGQILADGASKAKITAVVKDNVGANVKDGTKVLFTTTKGTVFASALTSNGTATTYLTSSTDTGTATVTATAGNVSKTINVAFITTVKIITLKATPFSIPADGAKYSSIEATVVDLSDNPSPVGTQVTYTTTLGTFPNGSQTYTVTTLDDTGKTTAFLKGTTSGTAQITATAKGVTSNAVTVTLYDQAPSAITLETEFSSLPADGASTSEIKATVTYGSNTPVPDGTTVNFSITAGSGTLTAASAPTTNGVATVTYRASIIASQVNTITAATNNGVSTTINIELTGPQVATIILTADPSNLPANGTSSSTISATVTVEGGSTAENIPVTFTIKVGGGTFTNGLKTITSNTGASGNAITTLYSDTQAGTATIGAKAGGISAQNIEVIYEPGSLTLTIVPNSVLATGEEECEVSILVKDADGQPVGNQQIDLALSDATLGSFDNSQPTTDTNGEATATFTAGSKGGTVTITATWDSSGTDVTGTGTINIQAPPAFIEIVEGYPDPQKINVKGTGGQGTSEIKFLVKDSQGNLVDSGYRIDFFVITGPNGGENLIPTSTKTTNGSVGGLLYSGLKSGPVSIRATYHHDTSISTTTSQVVIVGGPAVGEEFGLSARYLNVSGIYSAGLHDIMTANIADIYGNAIADNTAVSFKTYNTGGFFSTGTAVTKNGVASDDLVSGGTYLSPLNGFVSVTAEVVGGNTTRVTSIAVTPGDDNNIVYAGTNGGGIYKSMDSGATWQNISRSSENPKQGQNWIDPYVKGNSAICVDPDDHNTVYVGTGYLGRGHIFKSMDGGMNWNGSNIEKWNGIFSQNAAVLTVVCDGADNPDTAPPETYMWIGTEGQGAWYSTDDGATFTQSTGLGYGKIVTEIVRVIDSHRSSAKLYAATPTGVYYSADGGATWTIRKRFTNDIINTLILHPSSTDAGKHLLYAGTENAGVWFSNDGGDTNSWAQYYPNGMGEGLSATVPVPGVNNEGNGTMSDVTVGSDTESEFWTVTYDIDNDKFEVAGSVSGIQTDATVDVGYEITDFLSFTIYPGSVSFEDGDSFTFTTTRDPARTIKDLMVDEKNNRLYALTYFFGPLEPYHAVGNCYVHTLDPSNDYEPISTGSWSEANSGLPEYAPPRDTTQFAQSALAIATDGSANPLWFLIGGEGISMYKAKSGFATDNPTWSISKSGLSNLIMARIPVLFSGACTMNTNEYVGFVASDGTTVAGASTFISNSAYFNPAVDWPGDSLRILTGEDAGIYTIATVDSSTQVTLNGFTATANGKAIRFNLPIRSGYGYTVYIQDINGNPPISGSTFTAITYDADDQVVARLLDLEYPDTYTYQGTFSDPADAATDLPFTVNVDFSGIVVDHVTFEFAPTNKTTAPGSSGSSQAQSYSH